jgi:RNA polymerase sigma factor (sigma-70 family)
MEQRVARRHRLATLDDRLAARHLQTLLETGTIGGLPDGSLLDKFTSDRGDVARLAFAALVERHGSMVWRVCRGVLRDDHDAEDAFQNTFLVLARRAGSLWRQESVGPWLHGVAFRVAQHARSALLRRRRREYVYSRRALPVSTADSTPDIDESGPSVFEEIGRLPSHYRGVVVLCYLEGKSHEQARSSSTVQLEPSRAGCSARGDAFPSGSSDGECRRTLRFS